MTYLNFLHTLQDFRSILVAGQLGQIGAQFTLNLLIGKAFPLPYLVSIPSLAILVTFHEIAFAMAVVGHIDNQSADSLRLELPAVVCLSPPLLHTVLNDIRE